MLIDEAVQRYRSSAEFRRTEPSTQKRYGYVFRNLMQFAEKAKIKDMQELPGRKWDYIRFMQKKRYSPTTIKKEMRIIVVLATYFGFSLIDEESRGKWKYEMTTPEKQAQIKKEEERLLTADEIDMLFSYKWEDPIMNLRYHLVLRILTETGARINEVGNIKVGDVDLRKAIIMVNKSKTRPRKLYVSHETAQLFRAYFQEMKLSDPDEDVFPGKQKNIILSYPISRALREMEVKSPGKLCHSFRHYFATKAILVSKKTPQVVAHLMGITVNVLMKTYIHRVEDVLEAEARSMLGN